MQRSGWSKLQVKNHDGIDGGLKMKKTISILIFLLISSPVFSQAVNSSIELVYSGMKFRVPGDHVVIGSMGGNDNFLVFRYSNEPGKNT